MKKPTRQAISEGQRMDLHAGAAGKVILANSPEEKECGFSESQIRDLAKEGVVELPREEWPAVG